MVDDKRYTTAPDAGERELQSESGTVREADTSLEEQVESQLRALETSVALVGAI